MLSLMGQGQLSKLEFRKPQLPHRVEFIKTLWLHSLRDCAYGGINIKADSCIKMDALIARQAAVIARFIISS